MFESSGGEQAPGPGGPAALPPGLEPFAAACATVTQLSRAERAGLAGATPEQALAFTVLCDEVSRMAGCLRGEGILELATQWTGQNPTDSPGGDPVQVARFRAVARTAGRSIARVFPGHDPDQDDLTDRAQLADEFAVAEVSLACGVSRYAATTWLRHATALSSGRSSCSWASRQERSQSATRPAEAYA